MARTAKRTRTAQGTAAVKPRRQVVISLADRADNVFTVERSRAHVGHVFVAAETDPDPEAVIGNPYNRRAIVEISSPGFNFCNQPKGNAIMFECEREVLHDLGLALLTVAARVQHRHAPAGVVEGGR